SSIEGGEKTALWPLALAPKAVACRAHRCEPCRLTSRPVSRHGSHRPCWDHTSPRSSSRERLPPAFCASLLPERCPFSGNARPDDGHTPQRLTLPGAHSAPPPDTAPAADVHFHVYSASLCPSRSHSL